MRISFTALLVTPVVLANAFVVPDLLEQEVLALGKPKGPKLPPPPPYESLPLVDSQQLQDLITADALNASAIDLYEIAQASTYKYGHPTRVIGSVGHWKTVGYIMGELKKLKHYYKYHTQSFKALDGKVFYYTLSINKTAVDQVAPFQLTPPVHVTGVLYPVKNKGCSVDDYEGFVAKGMPKIALIERGECPFGVKSSIAGLVGAKAALIYDNESDTALTPGTLGTPTNSTVGTLAIQRQLALELIDSIASGAEIITKIDIAAYVGLVKTVNIIAETIHGDHDNVVALGAHSDSVAAGPGINDDGSGTISLLNVAKQLSNFQINNAVRFAWWSAEEEGLLGSNYYTDTLTPEENSKIRLFMDYDMMASPNFEYQVYDGSNTMNPNGSENIKNLYIDWYEEKGLNWTLIPFDGRSDYVGFIEHGIPGGGIATGAEGKNSLNGKVLDKCYHQLCDDLTNLAWDAFLVNTKLIAHSVATYSKDLSDFPAREPFVGSSSMKTNFKYRGDFLVL